MVDLHVGRLREDTSILSAKRHIDWR